MDLLCPRQVDPVRQSPRARMFGYFTHGTVPPPRPYSLTAPFHPNHQRPPPSPGHPPADLLGRAAFTALEVLLGSPTTDAASLATSLSLIGLLSAVPPADHASSPGVTHSSSVPCRVQTPWCGG